MSILAMMNMPSSGVNHLASSGRAVSGALPAVRPLTSVWVRPSCTR